MNLRLIGISAGVLIILSLPLAGAIAGPDFAGQDDGKGGGLLSSLGLTDPGGGSRTSTPAAGTARQAEPPRAGEQHRGHPGQTHAQQPQPGPSEQPRTDSRCGPELSSPQGLEAQTCVLADEGRTWGRSYYRNTSGRALDAVLTVMGPAGHTVQIRCAVGAGDEPGLCETPREDSAGAPDAYSAVAEFAVPDDEGRLLLRSGSNSPAPADG
ncbi:hypothetical protein ADK52_01190 [Streptomyces sp. WM6372]|uniref:hypothetical protein n=1 Tax=Streptomyces sp. WM6372 TaxID=1415555 RepID=UPI0006C27A0A|nr:hypothetical protein [Streptomyces sp. WM6372]KOU32873.1 hypothetical protein ADK52_01190 [Streptomyces sp. WM6372]